MFGVGFMEEYIIESVCFNRKKISKLSLDIATKEGLENAWKNYCVQANEKKEEIQDVEKLRELLREILLENERQIHVRLKETDDKSKWVELSDYRINKGLLLDVNNLNSESLKTIKFFINQFVENCNYTLSTISMKNKKLLPDENRMYILLRLEENVHYVETRTINKVISTFSIGVESESTKEISFFCALYFLHLFKGFMDLREIFDTKELEKE